MGRYHDLNRRERRCPVSKKGRIMDEREKEGAARAILYKPEDAENADWFLKCPNCKNQIGVSPIF